MRGVSRKLSSVTQSRTLKIWRDASPKYSSRNSELGHASAMFAVVLRELFPHQICELGAHPSISLSVKIGEAEHDKKAFEGIADAVQCFAGGEAQITNQRAFDGKKRNAEFFVEITKDE